MALLRLVWLALTLAAVSVGGLFDSEPAAAAPAVGTFDCHVRTLRVVFWPEGHRAVEGEADPVPSQVEAFAGSGRTYRTSDRVARVGPTGLDRADVAPRCEVDRVGIVHRLRQMKQKRRLGSPLAVVCSLKRGDLLLHIDDYATAPGQIAQRILLLRSKERNVLYAIVGTRWPVVSDFDQPILQYDATVCRPTAMPT